MVRFDLHRRRFVRMSVSVHDRSGVCDADVLPSSSF